MLEEIDRGLPSRLVEPIVARMKAERLLEESGVFHESTTSFQWGIEPLMRIDGNRIG